MTINDYSARPSLNVACGEHVANGFEDSWHRTDWHRMWLRTQSRDWKTLALVPGDDQTSTFEVANLIARLALDHGESVHVADTRVLRLKHVEAFLEGSRSDVNHGVRIIFATVSASANLATIPIARAADCAILCVSLGSTSLGAAKETIEEIGRKHFLGSLVVRAPTKSDLANLALPRQHHAPKARP